jgi:hypothetical protein
MHTRDEFDGIDYLHQIDPVFSYQGNIEERSTDLAEIDQDNQPNLLSNTTLPAQRSNLTALTDEELIEEAQKIENSIRCRVKVHVKIFIDYPPL